MNDSQDSAPIIVGLDPDSMKHGVAVFVGGVLKELHNLDLPGLRAWIDTQHRQLLFSIEDVQAQSFVYGRNVQASKASQSKIAIGIGKCQQAQIEVMRELDARGIQYKLFKPMSGNWAENKRMFEAATGWSGRSNSETRSAAFFGVLAVRATRTKR